MTAASRRLVRTLLGSPLGMGETASRLPGRGEALPGRSQSIRVSDGAAMRMCITCWKTVPRENNKESCGTLKIYMGMHFFHLYQNDSHPQQCPLFSRESSGKNEDKFLYYSNNSSLEFRINKP